MKSSSERAPVRRVQETRLPGDVPLYSHPDWAERFPWLVQGTTGRGESAASFDLRLFGTEPAGVVLARWRRLRLATGCALTVHAPQVHGVDVAVHPSGAAGFLIADAHDAHATRTPGTLLTVSVADCVPISLVDPEHRAIALLHGGWRGVAGGIIEAGIATLAGLAGSAPASLHVHMGPAICGKCYEVGPEVHAALGLEVPPENRPVDLRSVAAERAAGLGVTRDHITMSTFCTRCGGSPFFSHRGNHGERQVGVLGIRGAV